ncbi:hypothetical protein KAI32_03185 [Candidatus Pacearchaeota archaeon]|nr:hypothetical protein [Candidatus Pacearchaeota archaeon]
MNNNIIYCEIHSVCDKIPKCNGEIRYDNNEERYSANNGEVYCTFTENLTEHKKQTELLEKIVIKMGNKNIR